MKTHASVEFVRWPFDDDTWHVLIRAADAQYRVEQEFYTYPSQLLELANRLRAFPAHATDEARFEAGSKDPGWAHWVFLRAFLVDVAGHAALTIDVGSNGDELRQRAGRFTVGCDVASLNRLGDELRRWIDNPEAALCCRLYSS